MIKRFTIWTVALAGLLGAGACSDTFDPSTGSGEGTVVLDIALNDDVAAPAKAGSHKAPAQADEKFLIRQQALASFMGWNRFPVFRINKDKVDIG